MAEETTYILVNKGNEGQRNAENISNIPEEHINKTEVRNLVKQSVEG